MEFTKEQFEHIAPFYMDDFPIDSSNQDEMLKLFNILPRRIQGQAVSWGCSDTEVRGEIFEYLCDMAFDQTVDEYYESDNFKNYSEHKQIIPMDLLIQTIKNNQEIEQ